MLTNHPSIYTLIYALINEQIMIEAKMVKLKTGVVYRRKPKYILEDERLRNLLSGYEKEKKIGNFRQSSNDRFKRSNTFHSIGIVDWAERNKQNGKENYRSVTIKQDENDVHLYYINENESKNEPKASPELIGIEMMFEPRNKEEWSKNGLV
ncbi:unnamed protein product [Brachionus calyciflorus]|uniref:Uncharacterized protein n=1 Tax=Brachionus calyciflorus TaxID=104777 RepID=A0A814H898_9BILA|nr:unnamed protein product [Brachionus calyciflorus]